MLLTHLGHESTVIFSASYGTGCADAEFLQRRFGSAVRAPQLGVLLTVSDAGPGPGTDQMRAGFGSQIVQAAAKHLSAHFETMRRPEGYCVELYIPLRATEQHEGVDR